MSVLLHSNNGVHIRFPTCVLDYKIAWTKKKTIKEEVVEADGSKKTIEKVLKVYRIKLILDSSVVFEVNTKTFSLPEEITLEFPDFTESIEIVFTGQGFVALRPAISEGETITKYVNLYTEKENERK